MFDARSNASAIMAIWPIKVKRIKFTCRPFFILSLALVFLVNSLGGGLMLGEVWAAKLPSGLTSVGPDSAGSPSPLKDLNADTFSLPQELGYIQESIKVPDSTKTVIHIQDAHCNYAAQKSISELLNYLTTEYGIYAVNCEGGAEGYDLSPFTSIPEKAVRQKTSDYFVKEGVVSAAEYFAVNNPDKVKLWGVEDPDLYIKNLKVYRDSLSHKSEVDRSIKSISHILNNLKPHIYSSELLEFDNNYTKYKDSMITFKEYMTYLIMAAHKRLIDIKSFSNIYILSQTLQEEDKINFRKANNEKDEVVDKMKKILSRNELEELTTKVAQLKIERISQADFYAYIVKKAKSIKLDLAAYPELQKYIVYISLYSAIDRTKVNVEIDTLEDRIKESLCENDTQRELGILSKNLALTKNIFNISLTRDDYTYYKEHVTGFAVSNYVSFIDKFAPLYKIQATLDKNIAMLDQYREAMGQFYACSLERDKAFIKNIKFTDHDRPNSIIITGGFHTENLRELFNGEKVSYISIMPKFKNEKGYESPYMKRLAGQRTALESVIDTAIPAVLNLAAVNVLCDKLAVRVEGPAKMNLLRLEIAIAAAFMDNKPFVLKIDKGVVVEGTKPDVERFVTFTWPFGAGNATHALTTEKPSVVNATLTEYEPPMTFNFILNESVSQAGSIPGQTTSASAQIQTPSPIREEVLSSSAADKIIEIDLYEKAKPHMRAIERALRRGPWMLDIAPAISEEDMKPTPDSSRMDEQLLSGKGHNIQTERYLVSGEWTDNLKKVIGRNMDSFINEVRKDSKARMVIRLSDKDKAQIENIRSFIKTSLRNKNFSEEEIEKVMNKQVKFVPISFEGVTHFNAPLDLFVDIGMMEIDRYLANDYPGVELPDSLKYNFLALLKLSVTNYDEFSNKDIKSILNAIFSLEIRLKIQPVDWKSVDEWRKANEALLQSV